MKNQSSFKMRPLAAAGAALLALLAVPAQAVTYTVIAEAVNHLMPDGVSIVPMWGYRVSAPNGDLASAQTAPVTSPGAALVVPPTDSTLSVTLHNRLASGAPTSFVVHGLNTAMAPVFADAEAHCACRASARPMRSAVPAGCARSPRKRWRTARRWSIPTPMCGRARISTNRERSRRSRCRWACTE